MVKEFLLGDNPFIGVSHMSQEKAREEQSEATLENKVQVIEAAIKGGATGFTFSTHSSNFELLNYLRMNRMELAKQLNYYVLVPYTAKYVREATSLGTTQLIKNVFFRNPNYIYIRHFLYPSPTNFIKMFLETELSAFLKILPNIKGVLLHEVLTELILSFNLSQIVDELTKYFSKRGLNFGLETRNIKQLNAFIEKNCLKVHYVMTPINPLGYQMTPSKDEAEKAILDLSSKNVKIIAVNVLASGVISPIDSMKYLYKLKDYLYAIAIGTSKKSRAYESFKLFCSLSSII